MQAIIIEDEKPAARRLHRLLDELNLPVATMLHSVKEAVEYLLNNEHPDLIFLDIQLSDGLSFEIFDQVDVSSAIIFTTAYDEYALQAFKLNSIDYLLKPIDDDELKIAVDKFQSRFRESETTTTKIDFNDIAKMLAINDMVSYTNSRLKVKIDSFKEFDLIVSRERVKDFKNWLEQ